MNSIYSNGLVRVAACIPQVGLTDPALNAQRAIAMAKGAVAEKAVVAVFPELGLSGYSNEDLFQQDAVLDAALDALLGVVQDTSQLPLFFFIGVPLRLNGLLFNCAAAVHQGRILGLIPKTYLPNYREFYEKRHFVPASHAWFDTVSLPGHPGLPFGSDIVFRASNIPGLALHAEICEDLWSPVPPGTFAALAGATVLCNLSASNITVGKADYRKNLCTMQSAKCIATYVYTAAGYGESTTDLAWDGHALVCENGATLAESQRFADGDQMITADVDLDRLVQERSRTTSFADTAAHWSSRLNTMRNVEFQVDIPAGDVPLARTVPHYPYVPDDPARLDERCFEVYNIQVQGLMKRLQACGLNRIVIGVSGGLDSTQALLVAVRAMDRLNLPLTNIYAYTMPGFATSQRTYQDAWSLMRSLGVTASEIDIKPSCTQMLKDIDHPFSDGHPVYDVTFENVQAGERTSHLFRLANHYNAIVMGTGDLSELALGWCTYGVGDQMSHYNVNASVPKTLIRHIIHWAAASGHYSPETSQTLESILNTVISPELVPDADGVNETPTQNTEDVIGPYELQDFNLYYITRYGFRPSKVAFLATHAWSDKYSPDTVLKWLEVFLKRFFGFSQFKRSAAPNGPKVGSGGSLSPRADWRAPSDSTAGVWLAELDRFRRNM